MSTELGTWLRGQREELGWSRRETARRLISAARETGDNAMPDAQTVYGYVYRWENGKTRTLSERYILHFCRILEIKRPQFGPPPEQASDHAVVRLPVEPGQPGVPLQARIAYRGLEEPGSSQSTAGREVLMAAHEGSEHAARAEEHGIGDATTEQLRADLVRLAQDSDTGQPLALFMDLRRVRERVYQLLDRRLWPGEQADLYFILGCLNGLMGVAADRLGYPDSAEELLRAGWAYAVAIDHRPLLAHLRLAQSSVATWHGRPRQGRDLAADGLRYAAAGPGAADLHIKYATAAAHLGDADGARQAVTAAHDARQHEHRDDLLDLGGEFAISQATHHYLAGSTLGEIDGAQDDAAREIEHAVALYSAGPGPGEQHWVGARALASIDLAVIRLRSGALDAAASSLEATLALDPAQRITALTGRMSLVRTELAAPPFRRSPQAQGLDERIEDFTRDSVAAGLRGLAS